MIASADKILQQCEKFIVAGNYEDAAKCARGVSILTGQEAWQKAYDFLLSGEPCEKQITTSFIDIQADFKEKLDKIHDKDGQEYENQSVRGGTQVNLTHTEFRDWVEETTGQKVIGLWTVRLQKGGCHIPHLHPRGGKSHVIYVDIPDDSSGLIYFGTPRYARIPPQLTIKPANGMMLSFPCWLWHGVTEYKHEKPRLTLAFDTENG
jgi:hypothetical protein